ncbi:MAG: spore photoproduct lyase family protein [Sphaerochaetaceae bacterium]|jgi:spore photoproduct lyase
MNNPYEGFLEKDDLSFIDELDRTYGLSFQDRCMLSQAALEVRQWQEGTLRDFIDTSQESRRQALTSLNEKMNALRSKENDYSTFHMPQRPASQMKVESVEAPEIILGRCPCPPIDNPLRCCSLRTLDAVSQCFFGCSYCSIQNFYTEGRIKVAKDLDKRLEELQLPKSLWHIGTGQASDSLLLGDSQKTLTSLANFAAKHPDIIIEAKSKSANTSWIDSLSFQKNMIFTWSLNARTIIENEERYTPSLEQRLEAAQKVAEKGWLVGFHFHPMVLFSGWEEEYRQAVDLLVKAFDPSQVVMLSMGTLTFTKPVLRTIRTKGPQSKILEMELEEIAGKWSYPLKTKRKLFSTLCSLFPESWKSQVFFYLCMEAPSLWLDCLGHEYKDNAQFDSAMKEAYFKKVGLVNADGR